MEVRHRNKMDLKCDFVPPLRSSMIGWLGSRELSAETMLRTEGLSAQLNHSLTTGVDAQQAA